MAQLLVHSCYIKKGHYTGLCGIWCSHSTLKLRYGSIFAQSTSTNTNIFFINAGSSSYIRDCMIKPGNSIAIDGTADGYAQDCYNVYSMENQSYLANLQQKLSEYHPLKLKALEYEINNKVRLGNVGQAINKSFVFSEKYADLENGRRVLLGIADIFHFVTKDEDAEKKIY